MTQVATQEQAAQSLMMPAPTQTRFSMATMLTDPMMMTRMEGMANTMALGRITVPKHLQGNVGDCMAIVMQAAQWGMNHYAVGQKTFSINGVLGYEAQLVSAVINSSGAVKDRFHFEWFGAWEKIIGQFKEVESRTKKDDNGHPKKYIVPAWKQEDERGLGVRVWATLANESEPRILELLLTQARTRNSTLWTEDPKQQLAYLAQKRWSRLYAPDVILGVYTPDEILESPERFMGAAEVVNVNEGLSPEQVELMNAAYAAADAGKRSFQQWWAALDADKRTVVGEMNLREECERRWIKADASRTVDTPPPKPKASAAPAPAQAEAPAASSPRVTQATVIKMAKDARNMDELDVALDWVNELADGEQQAAIDAVKAREEELKNKG